MKILDIKIDKVNLPQAVNIVREFLLSKKKRIFTLVTPNPEIIVQAQEDKNLRRILNGADLSVPDGVGIIWANKFQKTLQTRLVSKSVNQRVSGSDNLEVGDTDMADKLTHRSSDMLKFSEFSGKVVPGIKLMEELCMAAAGEGWIVGLYGGRDGVAVEALRNLKKKYPGLRGWAETAPEINIEDFQSQEGVRGGLETEVDRILDKIKKTKTRILFVGLGAPKQEYFIERIKNHEAGIGNIKTDQDRNKDIDNICLMSVGGAFDEIAGRVLPAPVWISRLGLKWLWRLLQEPWRVRRQTRLVKYIWLVFKNGFTGFLDRRK